MTITTTTPLERIGTRLTEMDIIFRAKGLFKTVIQGITPKGYLWIRENMAHKEDYTVTIDSESEEELKELMRKDGLRV